MTTNHGDSTLGRFLVLSVLTAFAAAPAAALLSVVETLRDVPVQRPEDVLVSGDDRFVYVLGDSALAVLERDPATGFVAFVAAYLDGFDGVEGIPEAASMVLSPDDRFLYVASPRYRGDGGPGTGAVAIFERDLVDGTLSLVDIVTAGFDGGDRVRLIASSDGAHLYAASASSQAVLVFARDAANGGLSLAATVTAGIDTEAYALSAVLDPEDRYLYLTQATNTGEPFSAGRLTVYARDAATGGLTFVEDHVNQVGGIEDMDVPAGATVSPDGAHLYVRNASNFPYDGDGGALVAFRRDPATGRLTFIGRQDYTVSPTDAAWNEDGTRLYVTGAGGATDALLSELLIYARDAADGTLERIARIQEDQEFFGFPGVLRALALSGDRKHLYAGAFSGRVPAVWELEAGGGLRPVSDPDDPTGGRGALRGAVRAVASPDGRHLYVASNGSHGLAVYERDLDTGRLTLIDFVTMQTADEIGLVAVSGDGRWVYALESVFARDAATGLLDFVPQPGFDVSLGGADFAPSPDGRHLYVLQDTLNGPIAGYAQAGGGRLQPVAMDIPPAPGRGRLLGATSAAVSADGAYVYAVGFFSEDLPSGSQADAVWAFARDAASGALTLEAFAEIGPRTLDERRLAVAPNGHHVYLVQPNADDLLVFRHDRAARRLRLVERHADGMGGVDGLDEPYDVAVSPSDLAVYVAGRRSDAVAVFTRDPESGRLTFQGAVHGGPGVGDDLVRPQALAVAPDNRHVYVTSERLAAVTALALGCLGGFDELCLDDERFRVEVTWRDGRGEGAGHPVPLQSRNSGLFWFFGPDNWEMLVKVLDGCRINDRFWVFAAATTDVGYDLRVTDTRTGEMATYANPLGTASPAITDTGALHGCAVKRRPRPAAASAEDVAWQPPAKQGGCTTGPQELCLNGERFRVEVEWRDGRGQTGNARVVPFSAIDDSGLLWFFSPDNWEMLVKVLDGCGINDRYWVFAAATTNVGYTLRVTDVETGAVKEYVNPLGVASPSITDTGAFATCP